MHYPEDKFIIKRAVYELLATGDFEFDEYIKYLFETKDIDTLQTILEYAEEFGLQEKEKEELERQILLLKLLE